MTVKWNYKELQNFQLKRNQKMTFNDHFERIEGDEIYIASHLSIKIDSPLIRLIRHPSYKSDTMIVSIEQLERILEIARAKEKLHMSQLIQKRQSPEDKEQ